MATRLLETFDRIVVFDTETTGLDFVHDEIIELGAVCLTAEGETASMDDLIRLPPGRTLPPFITELTGITPDQLAAEGVEKSRAAERFCRLLEGARQPLLAAYNAQFDLSFLYYLLRPLGRAAALVPPRFLDLLTVYRDRRDYPHRLSDAIAAYGLGETAVNSHRAVDDARAALALLEAMETERDDLDRYLDLFGTHPKYGRAGKGIASVTYRPQSFRRTRPLYEMEEV